MRGPSDPPPGRREVTHLLSAGLAIGAWLLTSLLLRLTTRSDARARIERLAPLNLSRKNLGVELARVAFSRPDLLPIYGSSELARASAYRAAEFFADFPSGFAVFPIGDRGTPPLVTLEQLASVGDGLSDRKVVVFLSPATFTVGPGPKDQTPYAANVSRLQVGELLFRAPLDVNLKQRIAMRMLDFPELLEGDPFLRTVIEILAADGWRREVFGPGLQLLGAIQTAALEVGDDFQVMGLLLARPQLRAPVVRRVTTFDWPALSQAAETAYRRVAEGHAFGFPGEWWTFGSKRYQSLARTSSNDAFLESLRSSPRWDDLELLLRLLHDWQARALIVSIPFPGEFMDYVGVSVQARRQYYRRIGALCGAYSIRYLTFEDREYDPLFLKDPFHHPTPKGWVAFDSVLNAFYHDSLR